MTRSLVLSVSAGLVIGALAWIDPLFIPLVLVGPPVTGAIAGHRRIALRWVTLAWAVGGTSMLASDWIVYNEDRIFHTVLTVLMVTLASAGWTIANRLTRRRNSSPLPTQI